MWNEGTLISYMSYVEIFGELYQASKEERKNIKMNFIDLVGENENSGFERS